MARARRRYFEFSPGSFALRRGALESEASSYQEERALAPWWD
jgi:hypothetical protein